MTHQIARCALLLSMTLAACAHRRPPEGLRILQAHQGRVVDAGLPAEGQGCVPLRWTGANWQVRFDGPEVRAQLRCARMGDGAASQAEEGACDALFAATLDGRTLPDLRVADGPMREHVFAAVGAEGPHTLHLARRSEAQMGTVELCQVTAPSGRFLAPPPASARQMLVLGDSISAGYGNLCSRVDQKQPLQHQDGLQTYGALAAAHLGAEVRIMAWSGIGLWRNGDGTSACTLPGRWRARGNAAERVQLGAVVINLGTNDFRGPVDDDAFVRTYTDFAQEVAKAYPGAHLFLLVGPMLLDDPAKPPSQHHHVLDLVRQVQHAAAAQGLHERLHVLEMAPQDGALGFGCDYHPNLKTHKQMADTLAQALVHTLGWTPF